jgi:methionyl aminopeptidase
VTYEAMCAGIEAVRPGATLGDIGHAIQHLRRVAPLLGGARLLRPRPRPVFHDAPNVLHYGAPGEGMKLREGMFFTIEPMINAGAL